MQLDKPDVDAAFPASQALQVYAPSPLNLPATQLVQLKASYVAKVPEAHEEQLDAAVIAAYLPGSHALHEADPSDP